LIKLNANVSLKPAANNAQELAEDIMKFMEKVVNTTKRLKSTSLTSNENNEDENELIASSSFLTDSNDATSSTPTSTTSELCQLLSKLNIKQLLSTHDQIALRYDEQKEHFQSLNKSLQQQQQQQQLVEVKIESSSSSSSSASSSASSENEDEAEPKENNKTSQQQLLSDEGRFLLAKAQHYQVDNLKLVNIEKPDAPLGATIRNRDGCIVIGRIVVGGAAEQSGLLHEEDEILEINNIAVRGKTINDVCDMLCDLQGIVSFLIIPNMSYEIQPTTTTTTEATNNLGICFYVKECNMRY
jgi:C-terminal processing protease CtpA/Prc